MHGKGTTFKFSGRYSEICPAKLTNHTAHTNILRDIISTCTHDICMHSKVKGACMGLTQRHKSFFSTCYVHCNLLGLYAWFSISHPALICSKLRVRL